MSTIFVYIVTFKCEHTCAKLEYVYIHLGNQRTMGWVDEACLVYAALMSRSRWQPCKEGAITITFFQAMPSVIFPISLIFSISRLRARKQP